VWNIWHIARVEDITMNSWLPAVYRS
jgi:hypothetical protein